MRLTKHAAFGKQNQSVNVQAYCCRQDLTDIRISWLQNMVQPRQLTSTSLTGVLIAFDAGDNSQQGQEDRDRKETGDDSPGRVAAAASGAPPSAAAAPASSAADPAPPPAPAAKYPSCHQEHSLRAGALLSAKSGHVPAMSSSLAFEADEFYLC